MPEIEDAAIALWETPGQRAWRHRAVRSAAIVIVVPLWLGACAPITVEPSTGPIASPASPITAEPSAGPIALAPSMTGAPAPAPAPLPEPAPAVAAPEPLPPPAPAPAEAAAVETPAAPSPCPPGQIAVISKPDMAGTPVVLCRRPYAPR
jgi:2-oxoglutarate dehydrogenase E2 component (dihydrolipoamide succinyltransferase)